MHEELGWSRDCERSALVDQCDTHLFATRHHSELSEAMDKIRPSELP